MARTRYLKPDFFMDEDLAAIPFEARLLYAGLWCHADREGRLEDRPKRIKAEIFPYDDIDIEPLLSLLTNPCIPGRNGKCFVRRYTVDDRQYIDIPEFLKHQHPHHTEKESLIPPYNGSLTVNQPLDSALIRVPYKIKNKSASRDKRVKQTAILTDDEFLKRLKDNPAYKGVDIDRELAKMDAWLLLPKNAKRKKTRQFVVNWLNKHDGAMAPADDERARRRREHEEREAAVAARAAVLKKLREDKKQEVGDG